MSATDIPYTGPSFFGQQYVPDSVPYGTVTPDGFDQEGSIVFRGDGSATSGSGSDPNATPTVDYAAEARVRFPWLTGQMLDKYADLWAEAGSATAALGQLRDTAVYQRTFKGIMREDGTLRMDENTYLSQMAGFREAAAEFEIGAPANLHRLIEMEVDAREFAGAVAEAVQRFREPGADQDNGLVGEFVSAFMSEGSLSASLDAVRNSAKYDEVFAGNRREDGTLRMDEPEYFAYKRGWQRLFVSRNLNPEVFEARGRLKDAVEHEVSIQELDARIGAIEQGVLGNRSEVADWFASQYGDEWAEGAETMESVLAMAIDPDVGKDLLARRISASQIGGEAAVAGFARSLDRAEELARAGVGQGQARELYSEAAARLGGLDATTCRFRMGGTSIGDFEGAMALGDAGQRLRLTRGLQAESSSFSSRSDTVRERDGFGLAGLRQQ